MSLAVLVAPSFPFSMDASLQNLETGERRRNLRTYLPLQLLSTCLSLAREQERQYVRRGESVLDPEVRVQDRDPAVDTHKEGR